MLHAAVVHGLVFGSQLLQVAQQSPVFRGKAPAAHDHAEKLVAVGVLERVERDGRLAFQATEKGRILHAHVVALSTGDLPDEAEHGTETRVLAVVARIAAGEYDAVLAPSEAGYQLYAELRDKAAQIAATHLHLRVMQSPPDA